MNKPTPEVKAKERQEFERQFKTLFEMRVRGQDPFELCINGAYTHMGVRNAWKGWRARAQTEQSALHHAELELEQLRKDKERLDWLNKNGTWQGVIVPVTNLNWNASLRQAIDAAMNKGKEGGV